MDCGKSNGPVLPMGPNDTLHLSAIGTILFIIHDTNRENANPPSLKASDFLKKSVAHFQCFCFSLSFLFDITLYSLQKEFVSAPNFEACSISTLLPRPDSFFISRFADYRCRELSGLVTSKRIGRRITFVH